MRGTAEETRVDGFEERADGGVTEALVHKLYSIFFGRSVVGEGGYVVRWLVVFWGVTYTGAGSRRVCFRINFVVNSSLGGPKRFTGGWKGDDPEVAGGVFVAS